MQRTLILLSLLIGACVSLSHSSAKTKVLVLTGGHDYDTTKFNAMWNSMASLDWTLRPMPYGNEPFDEVGKWDYDVLVFYNHQDPGSRFTDTDKQNLLSLLAFSWRSRDTADRFPRLKRFLDRTLIAPLVLVIPGGMLYPNTA